MTASIELASKRTALDRQLRSLGRTLVAYSGGTDSAFLAWASYQAQGKEMLAVIADSPSLPRRELQDALAVDFPVRVIKTHEMANANYTGNPTNRCYFCKTELFDELTRIAGYETIV